MLSSEEETKESLSMMAARQVLFWTDSPSREELNFRLARAGFWVWTLAVSFAAAAELLFVGTLIWYLLR
jgi:hypothetical protein